MAISTDILIAWDAVESAVTYNLYRSIDGGSVYNPLDTGITETEYLDSTGSIDYYYKVAAVDQWAVEGDLSDPIQGYDPAETCRVYGSIIDVDATPADPEEARVEVTMYVAKDDLPRFAQNNLLTRYDVIAYPDERGIFSVNLVRNALVTLHIKQTGYKRRFMVPDADELKLEDIAAISDEREIFNPF
jgi:hypothetical protein